MYALLSCASKSIIDVLASSKRGAADLNEIDFEKCFAGEYEAFGNQLTTIVKQKSVGDERLIENSRDDLVEYLRLLVHLSIGFCRAEVKNVLFLLNIVVYRNLCVSDNDQLTQQAIRLFKGKNNFWLNE